MLDEYQKSFGESWRTVQADGAQPWPYLNEALAKFQVSVFFLIMSAVVLMWYVELCFSNSSLKLFLKDINRSFRGVILKNLF